MFPRLQRNREQQQNQQQQSRNRRQQQQQQQEEQTSQRILYTTRRTEERSEPPENYIVVRIDDATLRLFVRRVYIHAIIFIMIPSIAWLLIATFQIDLADAIKIPFIAWIILDIVLVIIIRVVRKTLYCFPLNWVMLISIMATTFICGTYLMCILSIRNIVVVLSGLLISFVITAMLYALGAVGPQKLMPGLILYLILLGCLGIPILALGIAFFFRRNPYVGLISGILLIFLSILQITFHAQTIHGRQDYIPLKDVLLSALIIFGNFNGLPSALGCFYYFHKMTATN